VKSIKVYTFLLTEINVCNLILFVQTTPTSTLLSLHCHLCRCRPHTALSTSSCLSGHAPYCTEISLPPCHSTVTLGTAVLVFRCYRPFGCTYCAYPCLAELTWVATYQDKCPTPEMESEYGNSSQ